MNTQSLTLGSILTMIILTKINEAEYIDDMYQNEYLYFKSLKDFRSSSEDKSGRLDPKELNLKNSQIKTLSIFIDSKKIDLHDNCSNFKGQLMEHLSDSKINCCSMHWLVIEPEKPPLTYDKRLLEMGNKALLIYNLDEFYKILDSSLEKLNLEYSRKRVTYYDPETHNGELTLHSKDRKYDYQNEYRILITPTDNNPVKIPPPGLKNISLVVESKSLENLRIEMTE